MLLRVFYFYLENTHPQRTPNYFTTSLLLHLFHLNPRRASQTLQLRQRFLYRLMLLYNQELLLILRPFILDKDHFLNSRQHQFRTHQHLYQWAPFRFRRMYGWQSTQAPTTALFSGTPFPTLVSFRADLRPPFLWSTCNPQHVRHPVQGLESVPLQVHAYVLRASAVPLASPARLGFLAQRVSRALLAVLRAMTGSPAPGGAWFRQLITCHPAVIARMAFVGRMDSVHVFQDGLRRPMGRLVPSVPPVSS